MRRGQPDTGGERRLPPMLLDASARRASPAAPPAAADGRDVDGRAAVPQAAVQGGRDGWDRAPALHANHGRHTLSPYDDGVQDA